MNNACQKAWASWAALICTWELERKWLLVVCDLAGTARLLGQVALFHGLRAGRLRSVLAICALNAAFLLNFFADLVEQVDKVLVLHGVVAFTPDHDIV